MKDSVAQIHTERIDDLMYELTELSADDISVAIKRIKHDLYSITDEGKEFLTSINKEPPKNRDVLLWLHYGQEKVRDALGYLQLLSDELDDIEDEVNRDEVNNARE